jgi:ribonuclease D
MPEPIYVTLGRDDVDLQLRHSRFDACLALGLDVEARPSYRRGQQNHRVDTIQLCSESACVVVSLAAATALPPLLGRIVSCPGILKFGCGVVDDLQLLARRFPATFRPNGAKSSACIGSCVELAVLAPLTGAVDASAQPYGLRRLAAHFGVELNKPKRIQMSDWSRVPLSDAQIRSTSPLNSPRARVPRKKGL